jgi:large subunit ribosomal protein L30
MSINQLKVTQTKSKNGRIAKHQSTLLGLGIRRIHHSVILQDTPQIRGMISKVFYMVKVEEVSSVS